MFSLIAVINFAVVNHECLFGYASVDNEISKRKCLQRSVVDELALNLY